METYLNEYAITLSLNVLATYGFLMNRYNNWDEVMTDALWHITTVNSQKIGLYEAKFSFRKKWRIDGSTEQGFSKVTHRFSQRVGFDFKVETDVYFVLWKAVRINNVISLKKMILDRC